MNILGKIHFLRELATELGVNGEEGLEIDLNEVADIILALNYKLQVADKAMQAYGWISCEDMLPEEKINPITEDFYEYQVTFQSGNVVDIRNYKFGKGHWWNFGVEMDEYVTAWRPNLTPYIKTKSEV